MDTFRNTLTQSGLSPEALVRASARLEAAGPEDRAALAARARARRTPGAALPPLPRPRTGRGASTAHVQAALAGQPLPRKVRGKLLRAVNALRASAGAPPLDAPALFGRVPARRRRAQA